MKKRYQMATSKAVPEVRSECPSCKESFVPVFYCKSRHSFCTDCTNKHFSKKCPLCCEVEPEPKPKFEPEPKPNKRCLEEMIKQAQLFCPNKSSGCPFKLFNEDQVNEHVKECIYRVSCPMETSGKCSWQGTVKAMKVHCKENHEANFITTTNEDINLEEVNIAKDDRRVFLYAQENFLFIVTFKIDTSKTIAYWTVQHIGIKKAARQYVYEIHVTSKHDPRRKTIFTDICFNHALKSEEVFGFGKCGVMSLSVLPHFVKDEKF